MENLMIQTQLVLKLNLNLSRTKECPAEQVRTKLLTSPSLGHTGTFGTYRSISTTHSL